MPQAATLPAPPLSAEKSVLAAQLIDGLDGLALYWLSGYMAGAAAQLTDRAPARIPLLPQAVEGLRLTVLYGSQTGNAKRVAEDLAARAEADGLAVRLVRADAYPLHELKAERLLYVVISTHSVGDKVEPPDDARAFIEHLESRRAPKLPDLKFAVLALGDTSYPDFCGIGRKLDNRLAELGGTRLFERGDADVDVDTVAGPWSDMALKQARELNDRQAPNAAHAVAGVVTPLHPARTAWTRRHPFHAEVLVNQRIVANDSGKDVRHIELSLEGSGITYQPGDALGVWPTQSPTLVDTVLATLGLDGSEEVAFKNETLTLSAWLGHRRELTGLTRPFLVAHAERGDHEALKAVLASGNNADLASLLATTQLLDLLRAYPSDWDAETLVAALRPLAPRMYSIASSQTQVGEEVHLTVDRLHYRSDGEDRWGVASHHLCALNEGDTVPVFVDANERFRLPADPSRDVIMIGPGTGVAPFRAFVQEREATGASGRNWLLFGNPHRRTDFLYQLEWQQARKRGVLTRLDVAFSRDQKEKVYVQHRIREHGVELWSWLDGGAHLYVCGDADRMAPDVGSALVDVAIRHGGKSRDEAEAWLKALMVEGRYARDVY
ncbi:MAG TPA: assimilatory sulfite reductase (NADPH) flavoprotein subunit [Rhodanobacteraceae bacterium]|nr:assimilatory sulfite reductase (NADPH) flavoprotein subunit [Rhodanobacteraceae bacterium]